MSLQDFPRQVGRAVRLGMSLGLQGGAVLFSGYVFAKGLWLLLRAPW